MFNGVEFKSRNEARAAYAFTYMQWRWYYEPEPFVTEHGPYLPDFFVQRQHMREYYWVEMKPPTFDLADLSQDDQARPGVLYQSMAMMTGVPLYLLCGLDTRWWYFSPSGEIFADEGRAPFMWKSAVDKASKASFWNPPKS